MLEAIGTRLYMNGMASPRVKTYSNDDWALPPPRKRKVQNESLVCLSLQDEVHQAMGVDA